MKQIFIILISFSALIINCGDKSTGTNSLDNYFPGNVGSSWVYSVYDSLTESSYDMTVSVVDTATLWDMPVTLWVYESDGNADTMFVSIEGDTVTFHAVRSQGLAKRYVFPLSVGDQWDCGTNCAWDYTVEGRGAVHVPARRFVNSYNIKGEFGGFNSYGLHSEWFVPYIGAVKIYRYSICTLCNPMVDINETWELKSYHLTH